MGYGFAARKCFAKLVCAIAAMAVAVIPLSSQVATSQKPSFEVTSVKPNTSGVNGGPITATGTRFLAANVTLRTLLTYAYRQPTDQSLQIIGAPRWIDTDRFDVEAKPASEYGAIPQPQMALMVQALLEDRFALRLHREQREVPIFILTVGKDGPKFKLSEDQSESGAAPAPPPQRPAGGIQTPFGVIDPGRQISPPPARRRGEIRRNGNDLTSTGVPLSFFASFLAQQVGRPVIDKTNLQGFFDFTLHWVPGPQVMGPFGAPVGAGPETNPSASDPSGSIFTALQEIGLKLESAKGPIEVLAIDHVQKPSPN